MIEDVFIDTLWKEITKAGPRVNYWNNMDIVKWDNSAIDILVEERKRRDIFLQTFAFAIPSMEAIQAIAKFVGKRKLLEVGAGTGLWAKLLNEAGVAVTAIDDRSWKGKVKFPFGKYFQVKTMSNIEACKVYNDHQALLLCWPDYESTMAYDSLCAFQGDKLIYIGEGDGGCTGDDKFHEALDENWKLFKRVRIPQWEYIHDEIYLYERKHYSPAANSR